MRIPSRYIKAKYNGKYIEKLEFYKSFIKYYEWDGEKRDPFKRLSKYADITQIHGIKKGTCIRYIESTPNGEDNLLQSVSINDQGKIIIKWDVDCGMKVIDNPNDNYFRVGLLIDSVNNIYFDKVQAWDIKIGNKWL